MGLSNILKMDFTPDDDARIKQIALLVAKASTWGEYEREKRDPGLSERVRALEAQETNNALTEK